MEEVDGALKSAREWLKIAENTMDWNMHAKAVYCMEMSVEAALKAVIIALDAEVPKAHDVTKTAEALLAGNVRVSKEFSNGLDNSLSTFRLLLKERTAAGYSFDYAKTEGRMKRLAVELLPRCKKIIDECNNAVKHVKKA